MGESSRSRTSQHVVGFGRVEGRWVGIVANQPMQVAGCFAFREGADDADGDVAAVAITTLQTEVGTNGAVTCEIRG